MPAATLTSKGQLTLPAEVRAALHLSAGDRVAFVQVAPGRYEVTAATDSVRALKGVLPKPKRRVTLDAMDAAVRAQFSRRA